MISYIARALVFSMGIALLLGSIVPPLETVIDGLIRAFLIHIGAFFIGLAIFYRKREASHE